MNILTISIEKSDSGKSTLHLHLNISAHQPGLHILVVDDDPLGNATVHLANDPQVRPRALRLNPEAATLPSAPCTTRPAGQVLKWRAAR